MLIPTQIICQMSDFFIDIIINIVIPLRKEKCIDNIFTALTLYTLSIGKKTEISYATKTEDEGKLILKLIILQKTF